MVVAVQHCKKCKSFDREANHTELAVLFRKVVDHKGILVRPQNAVIHIESAVVVAVQQHQGMTPQ